MRLVLICFESPTNCCGVPSVCLSSIRQPKAPPAALPALDLCAQSICARTARHVPFGPGSDFTPNTLTQPTRASTHAMAKCAYIFKKRIEGR